MRAQCRQRGFIPGTVIEINIALAVLGVVMTILVAWSSFPFKPVTMESKLPELVAMAADAGAVPPPEWRVTQSPQGATVIERTEHVALRWLIPALLVLTVISLFVWYFSPPFWVLSLSLLGAWAYSIHAGPVQQSMTIHADGAITLRASPRLAGFIAPAEAVQPKHLERVYVHKTRGEVYVVYSKDNVRQGWRIYTDTPAQAHALASLLQAKLPGGGKPAAVPVR